MNLCGARCTQSTLRTPSGLWTWAGLPTWASFRTWANPCNDWTRRASSYALVVTLASVLYVMAFSSSVGHAQSLVEIVHAERSGSCAHVPVAQVARGTEGDLVLAHWARCLMREGAFEAAVDRFLSFHERAGTSLDDDLPWLVELRARVDLHRGRGAMAARAFEDLALRRGATRVSLASRARWLYYQGLAHEVAGDRAEADQAYRELLQRFPGSPYASRVALLMPATQASASDWLRLAERARETRHYEASEALLWLAACGGAPSCVPAEAIHSGSDVRAEAAYQLGFLLYRFRREHVARGLVWLETLMETPGPRRADATHTYALAMMRMGRNAEARRAWLTLEGRFSSDPRAREAGFEVGFLWLMDRDYDAAIASFERYLQHGGELRNARAAQRWLAWSRFRSGDCTGAEQDWARMRQGAQVWVQVEADYWTGVCATERGDQARAEELFRGVIQRFPLSYYAALSARRLGEPLIANADRRSASRANVLSDAPTVGAALAVADLGLPAEAWLLARDAVSEPSEDVAVDHLRAHTRASAADWRRWLAAHRDIGRRVPTDAGDRARMQLVFPAFHEAVVRHYAVQHGLAPAMVWAVMQRESTYDPFAISVSDAMGLMQVIPQTAEAIAIRMGEAYADGDLFEPYHAIRYGTWYLGALMDKFQGQVPIAIGAYNAGPIAMERWIDRNPGVDFDIFVEEIEFEQARDYIKRVATIMIGYEIAHGASEVITDATLGGLFPHTIEPGYLDTVQF